MIDDYGYVVNVDGVVVRDGEYLYIERGSDEDHAAGQLAFPGGKLEAAPGIDDAIERTARRELAEEVGLEIGAVDYVCSSTFEADTGSRCLNVVTHCEDAGGEPRPDSAEVAAVHWLTPAELRAHDAAAPYLEWYVERVAAFRETA